MDQRQSYWLFLINFVAFFGADHVLERKFPARAGKKAPFSIPYWPGVLVSSLSTLFGGMYRPFNRHWFLIPLALRLVSGIILGLASTIALWSRWTLGLQYGREEAEQPPDELIQAGPYQVVRHPVYAAYINSSLQETPCGSQHSLRQ